MRKTKAAAAVTRESILDAAENIFYQNGVSNTRIEDIAHCAGVTRGAVYWHFKDKIDLFRAMHERTAIPMQEVLFDSLESDSEDPLGLLERHFVQTLIDLTVNAQKLKVFSILYLRCEYGKGMEEFQKLQEEQRCVMGERVSVFFEKLQKQGQVRADMEAGTLTKLLFSMYAGIMIEFLREPQQLDLRARGQDLVRMLFDGLRGTKRMAGSTG